VAKHGPLTKHPRKVPAEQDRASSNHAHVGMITYSTERPERDSNARPTA
jgi:hypothetical protein